MDVGLARSRNPLEFIKAFNALGASRAKPSHIAAVQRSLDEIMAMGYRPSIFEADLEEVFVSFINEDPDFESRYAEPAALIRAVSSLFLTVTQTNPKILASVSLVLKALVGGWVVGEDMTRLDKEEMLAMCELLLDTELHQLFWSVSQADLAGRQIEAVEAGVYEADEADVVDEELRAILGVDPNGPPDLEPPVVWSTVQRHQPELTEEENQRLSSLGLARLFSSRTQRALSAARILLKLTDRQIEVIARQRTKMVTEMREKTELDNELALLLGSDSEGSDSEGSDSG